jgi:hypothetical protein
MTFAIFLLVTGRGSETERWYAIRDVNGDQKEGNK